MMSFSRHQFCLSAIWHGHGQASVKPLFPLAFGLFLRFFIELLEAVFLGLLYAVLCVLLGLPLVSPGY